MVIQGLSPSLNQLGCVLSCEQICQNSLNNQRLFGCDGIFVDSSAWRQCRESVRKKIMSSDG